MAFKQSNDIIIQAKVFATTQVVNSLMACRQLSQSPITRAFYISLNL